jgi:hypothetical protein
MAMATQTQLCEEDRSWSFDRVVERHTDLMVNACRPSPLKSVESGLLTSSIPTCAPTTLEYVRHMEGSCKAMQETYLCPAGP